MTDQIKPSPNGQLRIGVYVCHCGINIASKVNVSEVVEFARTLPNVAVAREYKFMCSDPGQELIQKDIAELGINRVVVASCSPLLHEATFRKAIKDGGINEFFFQMANIREHVSWVTKDPAEATRKAMALIGGAVRRISLAQPLERRTVPVHTDAMVIGGGIAGIHAALVMAESGKTVYLVEKEPTIGGHMAMFDKTFPTLDCAACILTPKMSTVKGDPDIVLMTSSEVVGVEGFVGNFKVKVKRKATYVDPDKCTACADCIAVCPVTIDSKFDQGMSQHTAIYKAFPQAVPNVFVIEKTGRAPCRAACPAGVHAQGYIALIRQKKYKEAFQLLAQDLPTPTACGRACYHPCETKCERGKLDEPIAINNLKRFVTEWAMKHPEQVEPQPLPVTHPEKIAVVGAGPAGLACANELARRGYKVTVFEAAEKAGGMLRYGIPSYRLPEPVIDWDIERLKKLGIEIKTNSPVKSVDELKKQGFKAVFIATGASKSMKMDIKGEDLPGVVGMLEFLKDAKTGKIKDMKGKRVAVIGGGNSAMDAARTAVRLGAAEVKVVYRRTRAEMPALDIEVKEAQDEGVQFDFLVAPVEVRGNGKVEKLVCQRMELGEPDASGRRRPVPVKGSEFEMPVDMVIPAIGQVCDIKLHDSLNTDWRGLIKCDDVTLETGVEGVFAGGDIVTGPATIVDAFGAGKRAAESIDLWIQGKDLRIDRTMPPPVAPSPDITGKTTEPRVRERELDPKQRVKSFDEAILTLTEEEAVREATRCLECGVCSECLQCVSVCQPQAIFHNMQERIEEIEVGAIVIATGFKTFDARRVPQYGYGKYPNVYTSLEVERLVNASGPTGGEIVLRDGKRPKSVGIIHCVGSRDDKTNRWCSRVCCMYSLKLAHLIKERTGANVYSFYIDMRTPGKTYEEFYERLLKEGVHFIRGRAAEVTDAPLTPAEEGKLIIRAEDTLVGTVVRIPVDMVVLSTGLEPREDAEEVRRTLNIGCSSEGWFLERHPKLAPVSTFTDGIFIAGACQGPKDIPDTVAQAGAAAAEALALIDKGFVQLEPNTAFITEELCSGCKTCVALCPYSAISYDMEKLKAAVNEALCKGCGTCVAACPSGAAQQHLFTDREVFEEIEGVMYYV